MTKLQQTLSVILLILILTACGGSNEGNTPMPTLVQPLILEETVETAVPSSIPVATTESVTETAVIPTATELADSQLATETPEPVSEPDFVNLNADNRYGEPDVSSYRLTLSFASTLTGADGSVTSGTIFIEGARDLLNNASTFSASATGTADLGGGQQFSFTQMNETTYFILPSGDCFATAGNSPNGDLFAVFVDDGGILGSLDGAQPGIPLTETINGVLSNHYVFDETNLDPTDSTTPDVTGVQGDIYLAAVGGYVVRIAMQGQGSSNLLNGVDGDGEIAYELNYFAFDEPVAIAPPNGCSELPTSGG